MLRLKILLLLCAFLWSNTKGYAQVDNFKAAYIYNICRFVEWPSNARDGDFVVGVVGNKNVGVALRNLAKKKKLMGKKIVVKQLNSLKSTGKYHVLYVGKSYTRQLPNAVVRIGKNATLLVAEKNGAINQGAAINFVLKGQKLRFEVKHVNATRQNLKISSKINKLASKVY